VICGGDGSDEMLQLRKAVFVTFTTIRRVDVKVRGDTPNPNPFPVVTGQGSKCIHSRDKHTIGGKGMGYHLEDHFVTLLAGWR